MTDPLLRALEIAEGLPNDVACEYVAGPILDALSDRLIARMILEEHPSARQVELLHRERAGFWASLPDALLVGVRRATRKVSRV